MSRRLSDYAYPLPEGAIAQVPAEPRDHARLLVAIDDTVRHLHVTDLPELLLPGDLLVVNDSRVLPARLQLFKATGGHAEVLLLEPVTGPGALENGTGGAGIGGSGAGVGGSGAEAERTGRAGDGGPAAGDQAASFWRALVRPGRRLPPGTTLFAAAGAAVIEVHERLADGCRLVRILQDPWRFGTLPLPPYITRPLADPERYQTVYAAWPGSVAAPTAGLHLTEEVLTRCRARGVMTASVELRVGLDTFRPITVDDPTQHPMHAEAYRVSPETWDACQSAQRVVAVGTTTVRALESVAATGHLEGRTDLFIHDDFPFRVVDMLMTNFHLPRSSLLLLVEAFVGRRWRELYAIALEEGYRFLSFGDAMLLTRRPGQP